MRVKVCPPHAAGGLGGDGDGGRGRCDADSQAGDVGVSAVFVGEADGDGGGAGGGVEVGEVAHAAGGAAFAVAPVDGDAVGQQRVLAGVEVVGEVEGVGDAAVAWRRRWRRCRGDVGDGDGLVVVQVPSSSVVRR
jgi:hypothetical protein